jgi:hypothetical protein
VSDGRADIVKIPLDGRSNIGSLNGILDRSASHSYASTNKVPPIHISIDR